MRSENKNKRVLIVDDEEVFLDAVKEGLQAYSEEFEVQTAANGQEAIEELARERVDLLVTDLQMPEVDGFELLAHLGKHHPDTPAIVMTAYGGEDVHERLKALGQGTPYVEKPIDLDSLAESILKVLASPDAGFLTGINIPGFLQLMEIEKKTVSVTVRSAGRTGRLFLREGVLMDADTKNAHGVKAALDIISWRNTEIAIQNACPERERAIHTNLTALLLEACRIQDEGALREDDKVVEEIASRDETPESSPPASTVEEETMQSLAPEVVQHLEKESMIEGWLAVTPEGKIIEDHLNLGKDMGTLIAFLNVILGGNLKRQLGLKDFTSGRLILEDERVISILPIGNVVIALLCSDVPTSEDQMARTTKEIHV